MMDPETRKLKRLENKKRKAAAFLAIANLNDFDKESSKKQKISKSSNSNSDGKTVSEQIEPKPELETKYASNSITRISDKPLLEGEEYEDLKKRLRERKKALSCNPLFRLKSVGEDARVSLSKRVPLFMSDIQHLLTYCMLGDRAPYWPHRWCVMAKWNRLSNLVVLVVDGVGLGDYQAHLTELKWLNENISNLVEVVSPSSYCSSVAEELALLPLTVSAKEKLIKEFGSLESAVEKDEAFKAFRSIFPVKTEENEKKLKSADSPGSLKLKLLLSATQMLRDSYPIPLTGSLAERYKDYKLTKESYSEVTADSPLFSVDCEMCVTSEGYELTRICVVDVNLAVVYHSLVKPRNKIRNYLTQYSGITEEMLTGVTTRLEDVQEALQKLLPDDAILVGQSLNGDLDALKLMHPYVIDTSVCYNITGERGRKTKLSVLSHLFLNKTIQNQGKLGHNPIEDAQAAMSLAVLKLEKGLEFGDVVLGGQVPRINEEGVYNVPESKSKMTKHENLMTAMSKVLKSHQKTIALVCDEASSKCYSMFNNFMSDLNFFQSEAHRKGAIEAATSAAVNHNLTLCHVSLFGLEDKDKVQKVKKYSKKLFEHTSLNGMFMIILGGNNTHNAVAGIVIKKTQE